MKPSTHDEAIGKIHEVKGAIRQKVGQLTGNLTLEAEGLAEKVAGEVQTLVGKIEKTVGA